MTRPDLMTPLALLPTPALLAVCHAGALLAALFAGYVAWTIRRLPGHDRPFVGPYSVAPATLLEAASGR